MKKVKFLFLPLLAMTCALLWSTNGYAQFDTETVTSGPWNDNATWSSGRPGQNEYAKVNVGHTVTITGTRPVGSVEVHGVLEFDGSGASLEVRRGNFELHETSDVAAVNCGVSNVCGQVVMISTSDSVVLIKNSMTNDKFRLRANFKTATTQILSDSGTVAIIDALRDFRLVPGSYMHILTDLEGSQTFEVDNAEVVYSGIEDMGGAAGLALEVNGAAGKWRVQSVAVFNGTQTGDGALIYDGPGIRNVEKTDIENYVIGNGTDVTTGYLISATPTDVGRYIIQDSLTVHENATLYLANQSFLGRRIEIQGDIACYGLIVDTNTTSYPFTVRGKWTTQAPGEFRTTDGDVTTDSRVLFQPGSKLRMGSGVYRFKDDFNVATIYSTAKGPTLLPYGTSFFHVFFTVRGVNLSSPANPLTILIPDTVDLNAFFQGRIYVDSMEGGGGFFLGAFAEVEFVNQTPLGFTGTFSSQFNSLVVLGGTTVITDTLIGGDLHSLEMNRPGRVVLRDNATIRDTLNPVNGILDLNGYDLDFTAGSKIWKGSAASHIDATHDSSRVNIRLDSGTDSVYVALGDSVNFAPLSIAFDSATFGVDSLLSIRYKDTIHPRVIVFTHYQNSFWTIEETGITNMGARVYGTYEDATITGDENLMFFEKYDPGLGWKIVRDSIMNSTTNVMSGHVTSFSDFMGNSEQKIYVEIISHVGCTEDTNGSAFVLVKGGGPVKSYLWSTGSTNDTIFNLGPGSYSVTVTDTFGSRDSATGFVLVQDFLDPVPSCPADIVVSNDLDACSAIVTFLVTHTDNCAGSTQTKIAGLPSGSSFPLGVDTITFEATDFVGNTASCSFTIAVNDTQDPTIVCPNDTAVDNDLGVCEATVGYTFPVDGDNCPGNTVSQSSGLASPGLFQGGVTVNLFTVTDTAGNTATCSFTVTVNDTEAPTITCPADQTITTDVGLCRGVANFLDPTTADNCPGETFTISSGLPSGLSFPLGTNTTTFVVTDLGGNTADCDLAITVEDNEDPVAGCQNSTTYLDVVGVSSIVPADVENGSTDNCSATTPTSVLPNTFNCSDVGDVTVNLVVTDTAGNTASCNATVTVSDTVDPGIVCPNDTVVGNGAGFCSAVMTFNAPDTTDNCVGMNLVLSAGIGSGGTFPVGITTDTFTVTDASGNTATCDFTVTVNDTEAPGIVCPNDTAITSDPGACEGVTTFNTPITSDNCPGEITSQSSGIGSGGTFPLGVTVNVMTAIDAFLNRSSCSFTVTVTDGENPTIVCPSDTIVGSDVGFCSAVMTFLDPDTSDNCPGETLVLSAGIGSGGTFPVGVTVDTFTVTDAGGLTATCDFTITVNDTEAPGIVCPDDIVTSSYAGLCADTVSLTAPVTSDNCLGETQTLSSGIVSGGSFPVGVTTNVHTVTDASGNTASCSFTITVNDMEVPTVNCPSDTIVSNDPGLCSAVMSFTAPTTADNCLGETLSQSAGVVSGGSYPEGITTNDFIVTDASGNTATCDFTVTVNDTEVPSITCPADVTVSNDPTLCTAVVVYAAPTTGDNCPGETLSQSSGLGSGGNFSQGTSTEVYTVTDGSGNTSSCAFDITVNDTEVPIISCPADVTVSNDPTFCSAVVAYMAPTTGDNCPGETLSQSSGIASGGTFPLGTTTNVFTVIDASLNTASCSFTVTIVDTSAPVAICRDANLYLDVTGNASLSPVVIDNSSTDNCAVVSFAVNPSLYSCGDFGGNVVVLTVRDAANNSSSCAATVTVIDSIPPVVVCRDFTLQLDSNGLGFVIADSANGGHSDACGIISSSLANFSLTDTITCDSIKNGPYVDSVTVFDGSGNSASCVFEFDVSNTQGGGTDMVILSGSKVLESGSVPGFNLESKTNRQCELCFGMDYADMSNDGIPDILCGAPGIDLIAPSTGKKIKKAGGIIGYTLDANFARTDSFHLGIGFGIPDSLINKVDGYGTGVAVVGDIDGNGVADIAAGIPGSDVWKKPPNRGLPRGPGKGGVLLSFMSGVGQVDRVVHIGPGSGGNLDTLNKNEAFGSSIASGPDLDGDGIQELLVGAPKNSRGHEGNHNKGLYEGAAYLLFLNADGSVRVSKEISMRTYPELDLDKRAYSGNSLEFIGDPNNDGFQDAVIGEPGADRDGPTNRNVGGVSIVSFDSSGDIVRIVKITADDPAGVDFSEFGFHAWLGQGIAVMPDMNGDSILDLALGAPLLGYDDDGRNKRESGAIVILGMNADWDSIVSQDLITEFAMLTDSLFIKDRAAWNLNSTGDIDGNGTPDILVSVPWHDGADGHFQNGSSTSTRWRKGGYGFWYFAPGCGGGAPVAPKKGPIKVEVLYDVRPIELEISVYPNPNDGSFIINPSENVVTIGVQTILGETLMVHEVSNGENILAQLPAGTYIVYGTADNGDMVTEKVVVVE